MQIKIQKTDRRLVERAAQRGMTLIEIMIVIIIMASIATGVSLAVVKQLEKSRIKDAQMSACTIRNAVTLFQAENPSQCPSIDDLKDGYLDSQKRTEDPWNHPYIIDCTGSDPDVYSNGPDGSGSEPIRCKQGGGE